MEWLTENWQDLINIACYVVTAASVIVKMTPTKKDDAIVAKILAFLSLAKKVGK